MKLRELFLKHCNENKFEINQNQIEILEKLKKYYNENFNLNLFKKIFKRKKKKLGFYLQGDVGVGKTMILNFFF